MKEFLDVVLDSLIDTAKMLPILLVVYLLIEYLEYKKVMSFENSKLLKGKWSPIFGSVFGCIPQCGFSVVSTDLFSKKRLSVGALVAVYFATSDEALPIMLSNPSKIVDLIGLLAIKLIMGIAVGYLANFLYWRIFKTASVEIVYAEDEHEVHEDDVNIKGCCKHEVDDGKFHWAHPLLHCLKIAVFILIVNIIFGTILMLIGEDKLGAFLQSSYGFQPVLACAIGLIPNCASSVVLTELYIMGGISFGSVVTGLCVNAGLGLLVLFRENKNVKENAFVIGILVISSLAIGYILHYIV